MNSADGTQNIRPGSFITISGAISPPPRSPTLPPPTVLGGSCVTFSDVAVPLLQTSSGQIQAQVPDTCKRDASGVGPVSGDRAAERSGDDHGSAESVAGRASGN